MKFRISKPSGELLVYIFIWIIVFALPIADKYIRLSMNLNVESQWSRVFELWIKILPFFILFIIHNFFLLPKFLLKKKPVIYIICSLFFIGLLEVSYLFISPDNRIEMQGKELMHHPIPPMGNMPPPSEGDEMHNGDNHEMDKTENHEIDNEEKHPEHDFGNMREGEDESEHINPDDNDMIKGHHDGPPPFMKNGNGPMELKPLPFIAPFIIRLILSIFMIGANIGIKLLFKSRRDEKIMKELEHHNLQQELEYLKYQLNPHFFMNTLNNIHALIDIDSEKAKDTVIELSQLMRYVLYDGSHKNILLSKEIEFLTHYIELMKLRYVDKVQINVDFPTEATDILVPPLLFITFVENAFKHGISYQSCSFIDVAMKIEGEKLSFTCENSCHETNQDKSSGIGLENVSKRLKLLYENDYVLNIDKKNDIFKVLLVIPINI